MRRSRAARFTPLNLAVRQLLNQLPNHLLSFHPVLLPLPLQTLQLLLQLHLLPLLLLQHLFPKSRSQLLLTAHKILLQLCPILTELLLPL